VTHELTHFTAAVVFSLFASIVFGITQKEGARDQFRYGVKCFVWFVAGVVIGGWALWILKH
jgi:hypothetical protein